MDLFPLSRLSAYLRISGLYPLIRLFRACIRLSAYLLISGLDPLIRLSSCFEWAEPGMAPTLRLRIHRNYVLCTILSQILDTQLCNLQYFVYCRLQNTL